MDLFSLSLSLSFSLNVCDNINKRFFQFNNKNLILDIFVGEFKQIDYYDAFQSSQRFHQVVQGALQKCFRQLFRQIQKTSC
jgi:hypothetical protein